MATSQGSGQGGERNQCLERYIRQHDKLEAVIAGKDGAFPPTEREVKQHLSQVERNRAATAGSPGATHGSSTLARFWGLSD